MTRRMLINTLLDLQWQEKVRAWRAIPVRTDPNPPLAHALRPEPETTDV